MRPKTYKTKIKKKFTLKFVTAPKFAFQKYGDIKTYIAIIEFPTFMPALTNGGAWFG